MKRIMKFGSVKIAAPSTVSHTSEKIWSRNAQRSADGTFQGHILCIKKTITLTWEHLTPEETRQINSFINSVGSSLFNVTYPDENWEDVTITVYAATPTYETWGWNEDRQLTKNLSVQLIQQ